MNIYVENGQIILPVFLFKLPPEKNCQMSASFISETWAQLNRDADPHLVHQAFNDITTAYSGAGRHYHNLQHIAQLLTLHQQYAQQLQDPETVLFAIFFHDIVYNVLQSDNEEKSADAAVEYLQRIHYPSEKTTAVKEFIVATKTHVNDWQNTDLDYFLDFDLQILGTAPDAYLAYTRQIRQEYSIYPDLVYHPGRKKVLHHFLEMPAIFRTHAFQQQYETAARQNIQAELDSL